MSNPELFLEELRLAKEQGERTIMSLLPGDSFVFRGYHTIRQMQQAPEDGMIFVTTTPEDGYPKGRTFLFHGLLMFPSFLTDGHFKAEQTIKNQEW